MTPTAKKGTAVHPQNCSCGYQATDPDGLDDHLREVFTPDDDKDADGHVHAEAAHDNRACLCGFTADDIAGLDAHLLLVFTPPDAIGHDGHQHVPASRA
jgi:hypothetical protein